MVSRSSDEVEAPSRGFQARVSPGQEHDMAALIERLGYWPNKQSFVREAVNDLIQRGWTTVANRQAAEAAAGERRARSVHDVEREPGRD